MKGLMVQVFRSDIDASNAGLSARFNEVVLLGVEHGQVSEVRDDLPAVEIRTRGDHVFAVPKFDGSDSVWWMMGGTFLYSCDSRFGRTVWGPIPFHDRREDLAPPVFSHLSVAFMDAFARRRSLSAVLLHDEAMSRHQLRRAGVRQLLDAAGMHQVTIDATEQFQMVEMGRNQARRVMLEQRTMSFDLRGLNAKELMSRCAELASDE